MQLSPPPLPLLPPLLLAPLSLLLLLLDRCRCLCACSQAGRPVAAAAAAAGVADAAAAAAAGGRALWLAELLPPLLLPLAPLLPPLLVGVLCGWQSCCRTVLSFCQAAVWLTMASTQLPTNQAQMPFSNWCRSWVNPRANAAGAACALVVVSPGGGEPW